MKRKVNLYYGERVFQVVQENNDYQFFVDNRIDEMAVLYHLLNTKEVDVAEEYLVLFPKSWDTPEPVKLPDHVIHSPGELKTERALEHLRSKILFV